jgi:FMN reductase
MKVVVISGSPRKTSNTQIMMKYVYDYTKSKNDSTKLINLSETRVDCYCGPGEKYGEATLQAAKDITEAQVWMLGTPIYNSFFSSAFKNLFEYIDYKKTAGKVAGMAILASGNIGFTDVQTLVTQLMSYFRVITNPKAVYMTVDMIKDGNLIDDARDRLRTLVDETLSLASKQI